MTHLCAIEATIAKNRTSHQSAECTERSECVIAKNRTSHQSAECTERSECVIAKNTARKAA
jgi:hypothetical protein